MIHKPTDEQQHSNDEKPPNLNGFLALIAEIAMAQLEREAAAQPTKQEGEDDAPQTD